MSQQDRRQPVSASYCLFGAAPDTGNLGVTALHDSVVAGLRELDPSCSLTVFDHGRNGAGSSTSDWLSRLGAQPTRRIWRSEALWNMRVANLLGGAWNPGARRVRSSAAVLDLSGGDSFSDIYGQRRFEAVAAPKQLALDAGVPLVLLPQTYGPYESPRNRAKAAQLVRNSAVAWARDARSFEVLKDLLGSDFDAGRHLQGVDVAFGLPVVPARQALCPRIESWLTDGRGPVIGLNVSGLVYLDPDRAASAFRFRDDYSALLRGLVLELRRRADVRIALVPHVLRPRGHYESDLDASERFIASLGDDVSDWITAIEGTYGPSEIKELISRLDWFCGTRMHSTIAALSTATPVAGLAYSPKFHGVFQCCDMQHRVLDLTSAEREEGISFLVAAFDERQSDRARLEAALPGVRSQLVEQLNSALSIRRDAT